MPEEQFALTPTGQRIPIVPADEVGFSGLTAEDFLKILITELQNQDPTEPVSNQDLIDQLSSIQSLQSNVDLGETLDNLAQSQLKGNFTSSAASLIGKQISARDESGQTVSGIVDRALFIEGEAFVEVEGVAVPVDSIETIASASAA